MMTFRPYQQDAFDAIVNELQTKQKCIVKMFCGSGKSRIMHNLVKHYNLQLSVFVFPSLSLIDQFHIDYLKDTIDTKYDVVKCVKYRINLGIVKN
jgi:superfamily II DNA or RNA helicase